MGMKFLRRAEYRRRKELWEFLQTITPSRIIHQLLAAHDNPINPGDDKYVRSQAVARKAFDARPEIQAFFIGHSHHPRIFTYDEEVVPEPGRKYELHSDRRCIINVGSVGQPRDKDPRACYVLLEPDNFRFLRIPYDLERTMKKIYESELHNSLADRLKKGL